MEQTGTLTMSADNNGESESAGCSKSLQEPEPEVLALSSSPKAVPPPPPPPPTTLSYVPEGDPSVGRIVLNSLVLNSIVLTTPDGKVFVFPPGSTVAKTSKREGGSSSATSAQEAEHASGTGGTTTDSIVGLSTVQNEKQASSEPGDMGDVGARKCLVCCTALPVTPPKSKIGKSNVEGGMFLRDKPFGRSNNTREAEKAEKHTTLYDIVNYIFSFWAHGKNALGNWNMKPSPLGCDLEQKYRRNGDERVVCQNCLHFLKLAIIGIKGIAKRLSKQSFVHAAFLTTNGEPEPASYPVFQDRETQTASSVTPKPVNKPPTAEERILKLGQSLKGNELKDVIHHLYNLRNQKLPGVKFRSVCRAVRKIIFNEMNHYVKKTENCSMKDYGGDEMGFLPPDELVQRDVELYCPFVKEIIEGLCNSKEWNRKLTVMFALVAHHFGTYSVAPLQKTISLAIYRIGAPHTMFELMNSLDLSWSHKTTHRWFNNKTSSQSQTTRPSDVSSRVGSNEGSSVSPNCVQSLNVDQDNCNDDNANPEPPVSQTDVRASNENAAALSEANITQPAMVIGGNLPRKRLWPFKNKPSSELEAEKLLWGNGNLGKVRKKYHKIKKRKRTPTAVGSETIEQFQSETETHRTKNKRRKLVESEEVTAMAPLDTVDVDSQVPKKRRKQPVVKRKSQNSKPSQDPLKKRRKQPVAKRKSQNLKPSQDPRHQHASADDSNGNTPSVLVRNKGKGKGLKRKTN